MTPAKIQSEINHRLKLVGRLERSIASAAKQLSIDPSCRDALYRVIRIGEQINQQDIAIEALECLLGDTQ